MLNTLPNTNDKQYAKDYSNFVRVQSASKRTSLMYLSIKYRQNYHFLFALFYENYNCYPCKSNIEKE